MKLVPSYVTEVKLGTGQATGDHLKTVPEDGTVTVFNIVQDDVFAVPAVVVFQFDVVNLLLKSVATDPPKPTCAVIEVVLNVCGP